MKKEIKIEAKKPRRTPKEGGRRPSSGSALLFGFAPLKKRVELLAQSWESATTMLRQRGGMEERARRLEMCAEELRMILDKPNAEVTGGREPGH